MDEQTRLNLEQRLEDVLRRDLGAIPVRPFAMYSRSSRAAIVHPIRRMFSIAGAAAVVAVVILVALAAAFALRELKPTPATVPVPSTTPSASPSSAASVQPSAAAPVALPTPVEAGAITGRILYNAGFIPALTVYAINTADQARSFFVQRPRFAEGQGPNDRATYSITGVAPGTYWVVAWRDSDPTATNQPGLYSQFVVRCVQPALAGVSPPPPECNNSQTADHTLVPVTVRSGETVSRIDVGDWSYDQASYPPRPTADSGLVNVCGAFNAYMPASSGRNAVLSMGTPSGLMNFELVLSGTVPPDLQQNGAQLVRLTGRRVQGINTVADYNVARVTSCSP
jgi:hypothetical protein